MKKIYLYLLTAFTAVALLTGCSKLLDDNPTPPNPDPNPDPAPTVVEKLEVEEKPNVLKYNAPEGQQDDYIISYEDGVLQLRYEEGRSLRADNLPLVVSYRDLKSGKMNKAKPQVGDIICLPPSEKFPDAFVGKITQAEYGAGSVMLYTQQPVLGDVAEDVDVHFTKNLVDLVAPKYGALDMDLSKLLRAEVPGLEDLLNKPSEKGVEAPKVKLATKGGQLLLTVEWDALGAEKKKGKISKDTKAELKATVAFEPNITFRLKKRANASLPELCEAVAHGKVSIDIDAEFKAALKKKFEAKPIRLATIKLPPIPIGTSPLYITSSLVVEATLALSGEIEASVKILQYTDPYEYKVGYDKNRSSRWYHEGDKKTAKADWLKQWSVEGSLNYTEDFDLGLVFTINGWEGFKAKLSGGYSIEGKASVSIGQGNLTPEAHVTGTIAPYLYAGLVLQPKNMEWLEYTLEKKIPLGEPVTLFDKKFSMAYDVRTTAKEARDITDNSAVLGGTVSVGTDSKAKVIEVGVCYATHSNPKVSDQLLTYAEPKSTGDFDITAKGLSPATDYYYRAYTKYQLGDKVMIAYSPVETFTTEEASNVIPEGVVIEDGVLKSWPATAVPTNGHVTVPEQVTKIENSAFFSVSNLKTITLPKGLKSIGASAFSGCTSLEAILIPQSVTEMGDYAFSGCVSLKTANIPSKVQTIGRYTFYNCYSLEAINLPNVRSIGNYAFQNCHNLKEVRLTTSLISIGNSAFQACRSLSQIAIPNSVGSLGSLVLSDCIKLKEVTLPVGLVTLPHGFFFGCKALESITLPANVHLLDQYSFSNCPNLQELRLKPVNPPEHYGVGDSYTTFDTGADKKIKIIVPKYSKSLYEKHHRWQTFTIEEEG